MLRQYVHDKLTATFLSPTAKAASIVFVVVFILITIALTPQAIVRWPKARFMSFAAVCGVGEIMGWAFRLYGHTNPFSFPLYIGQLVVLIISK